MEPVISVLHVVGAVFIVGPMAILPMSAMRAARAGNIQQVSTLATSTAVFSYLSLVVFVLGFALVGLADPKYELSVTTPWVLASIVLYVIALAVSLGVVVPGMKRAVRAGDADAAAAGAGDGGASGASLLAGRLAISAGSGVVALLLVAVVVLMVWKP